MSYRYFAYGATLDPDHFGEWAREHQYGEATLGDGRVAVLDDHELVLSVPSRYWGGGVGTVVERPGGAVWGALFTLEAAQADMVRHKEGVAGGLYREIAVEARVPLLGGADETVQLMAAHAFVAAPGRTVDPLPPPSARWIEVVVRGAQARGLPGRWLAELRRKSGA